MAAPAAEKMCHVVVHGDRIGANAVATRRRGGWGRCQLDKDEGTN